MLKKVFYVFGFILILVLSYLGELKATLEDMSEQLELISSPQTSNVVRRQALMRLEELRQNWPVEETFESQIAPLKPKLISAAKVIIEECLPECVCPGFCIVQSVGKGRGIVPVFSFFAHWPIAKEDIQDVSHRVRYAVSLAKTFPNWLDHEKAQPLFPDLTRKFGAAEAYDLSAYSSWQIKILKFEVHLDEYPYLSTVFHVGAVMTMMSGMILCLALLAA